MAEVTSGKDLVVIVLTAEEADALGGLLMWATTTEGGRAVGDDGPIDDLIEAMYPTWTQDEQLMAQEGLGNTRAWKGAR